MARCFGDGDELYAEYHDTEWGVPPPTLQKAELFEQLSLEVFQVGLSWLLILRRRDAFRQAFDGFDVEKVAKFTDADVDRLAADASIIRNRRKIEATIGNARAVLQMHAEGETLAGLFARHRPEQVITRRESYEDLPTYTPEAEALTKELKARGLTFVGPTNMYAMMQSLGLVDDHLAPCPVARNNIHRPDVWDEVGQTSGLSS